MSAQALGLSPELQTALQQLSHDNAELSIGNGCFVYDLEKLQQHLAQLQQQDVVKLWYAVKANPLSKVIQTLDNAGFNFDVASSGELNQVLAQGIEPERVLNTGPAKSKQQIHSFIKQGVRIFVAESLNQLQWLEQEAAQQNIKVQVLLRVQLQWPDGEKNPLGGNALTPFGLSVQEWQSVQASDFEFVEIIGLHIFQWGNMLSNAKMYQLWQQMVPPLVKLAQDIGISLKVLDLGGGLGVDYLQQGTELSWQQTISDLAEIKSQAGVSELWLELGRYAVAECGYYLTPVVDKKINYDQPQLVMAGGINHILRPAITDQPFPAALLRDSSYSLTNFDVHGPLCTSMDKLGALPFPEDIDVDDVMVFGLCGAYGFSESMPFFLCHEIAAEYVWKNNQLTEVRCAQPASWYLR